MFSFKGLAEWNVPQGGMFLWMKILGLADTHPMIMKRALKKDVILLPGREFMTDPSKPCPYVRAAFSLATPENIDRVIIRTLCSFGFLKIIYTLNIIGFS